MESRCRQAMDWTAVEKRTGVHTGLLCGPRRNRRGRCRQGLGFTLIELLVVIAIIAILAAYPWDLLAETTRAAILAYAEAGGGLLLVTPWCAANGVRMNVGGGFHAGWAETGDGRKLEAMVAPVEGADARHLLDGIPWRHVPMFKPQLGRREPAALFRAGRVGQGRLLIYDLYQRTTASTYQCLTPDISYAMTGDTETRFTSVLFDPFDYDYAVGAAARAALWAAGRDPKAELRQIVFESAVVEPRLTPGQRGQWRIEALNTGGADLKAEIRLTLRGRGPDAPTELKQTVTLKPGRNRISFAHTLERVGQTFADVRLLLDGKTADWGSGCLDVLPGNPYLGQVKADRDLYAAGQAPRLEATFSYTKYAFRAGELGELRWRLYDGFGRLVERGAGLRQAVAAFLGAQSLQAPVRAVAADGGWEPLDVAVWQHGASRFAAFKREIGAVLPNPEPRAFELVNAAGKAHVYDSRAGKYLGEADRVKLTVEKARGGMLAFLPYKAEMIQMDGLPAAARRGERFELRLQLRAADGRLPEGGVFRVECFDPTGRKVAPLSGKHAWGLGGATVPLVIAHNDPVGEWQVTVTDVATGSRVEKALPVR